jgi:amino acid transporter
MAYFIIRKGTLMISLNRLTALFFGKPLLTSKLEGERLNKFKALPILSADALSSVAYGTEAILRVLVLGGAAALMFSLPVALAICGLILILGASYWQTIEAYPNGGGAFTVARENLGTGPSLLAAAALLLDYLLTVAVSVTAGVLAVTSAFPVLIPHTVFLCVIVIIFIAVINLRGVRESGTAFALPTYFFIFFVLLLFGILSWKVGFGELHPIVIPAGYFGHHSELEVVSILLILRAFAMGCTALTGIECIANAVPIFEKPEPQNARKTLIMMIALLGIMFFGVSYFTYHLNLLPSDSESLLSLLAHMGFGEGVLYYALQVATALILLLAANTAFTGFPRLASILSQHQYLPKQLNSLGDRLSFSNGVVLLALLSSFLVILFHGNSYTLLPLYSIGVFLAFTISQMGMVMRWYRLRTPGWRFKLGVNLLGCITTGVALCVIIESKFIEGAWIMLLLIPFMLLFFMKIARHYSIVERELEVNIEQANHYFNKMKNIQPKVIIPVSKIHRGTLAAIYFARDLSEDVTAVVVNTDEKGSPALRDFWGKLDLKIPLVELDSPYRSTIKPLQEFIKLQDAREPERGLCVIVLPKAITSKWWHSLLHNHRAALFKASLYANKSQHVGATRVFVDVPYQLKL